jgi:hypothetical protein
MFDTVAKEFRIWCILLSTPEGIASLLRWGGVGTPKNFPWKILRSGASLAPNKCAVTQANCFSFEFVWKMS